MKKLFQAALVALMLVPSWGLAQDYDKGLATYKAENSATASTVAVGSAKGSKFWMERCRGENK